MKGCHCVTSLGSSGATCGLFRCCILTTAGHVHDLIFDVSLHPKRMVFIKLFELSTISFEHRRRVIQNI